MLAFGQFIGWFCLVLAIGGTGFTLLAAGFVRPQPSGGRSDSDSGGQGPATLLKPLHLAEPGLEDNLRSFLRQDYQWPIQVVFGVRSYADPALQVVSRLKREFPAADIDVVVDSKLGGSNPKIANLINMIGRARHDLLVLSDSDIRVETDYVRKIALALDEPDVGAVSCLYSGYPLGNMWSTLAAMGIDYQFLPNARVGIAFGLTEPCFGSTIAMRRQTLTEIGGFEAVANVLADDFELGRAIREMGYRLAIPTLTVEHVCGQTSLAALFRQELRWAKTTLTLAGAGYGGTLVTFPLPLALLAAWFLDFSPVSLGGIAAALLSRTLLVVCSGRPVGPRAERLWLLPLRDVLSFGVFAASFFGRTVDWRGTRYLARADGALAQL
jgi:ceramide glucosyltransferase